MGRYRGVDMAVVTRTNLCEAQGALTAWLSTRLPGAEDLGVSGLDVPPASGFSNETVFFDASWREQGSLRGQRMVARLQADGPGLYPEYDIAVQFRVMRALERYSDVAVPRMLWIEDDAPGPRRALLRHGAC